MQILYRRLAVARVQMERLAAQFQAGALRRVAVRPAVAGQDLAGAARPGGARDWPGRFGWLVRLVAWEAAQHGPLLRAALEAPEMVALLTVCPQAVRIMRPICRMMAIETSVLRPGVPVPMVVPRAVVARVRRAPVPLDFGRIPLPRGVLAAARRQGYGRRRDYFGTDD